MPNITTIEAISLASQKFVDDIVHLEDDSGWTIVDGVLLAPDNFFRVVLVDLENDVQWGFEYQTSLVFK